MNAIAATVLISVGGSLVAAELFGLTAITTRWLVRQALRRLPAQHRARYCDEWAGELDAVRDAGPLTRFGWAFTVFVTAGRTARVLEALPRTVAPHDLIWGTPDPELDKRAYDQARREIAAGNVAIEEDANDHAYRSQFAKWVELPPDLIGKHGDLTFLPGAAIKLAPLTFSTLVLIWKRTLLREQE